MRPVPLSEATDEAAFGGKAVQLGHAMRAGLPVPAGVALGVSLVDAFMAGDPEAARAAESVLSSVGPSVAARSSVVGEDGSAASFAGLHATILNVTSVAELRDAIKRIWESGRSEGAMAYRQHRAIAGAPQVAVVVQVMVRADRAGVMFTHNPVSGHDERVIEAAWGLGEAIVAGLVTPDFYRLDRAGAVLERRAGMKDRMIAFMPTGGTHEIAIEPARHRALCLEAACLSRLHHLAEGCERAFGTARPHDIEWAFEGPSLHLLQRRSVTAGGV